MDGLEGSTIAMVNERQQGVGAMAGSSIGKHGIRIGSFGGVLLALLCGCSSSPPASVTAATFTQPSASPLPAPADVVVSGIADGVRVGWAAPPLEGSATVTGFALTLDGGAIQTVGPDVTTYTFTGLAPGSSHTVKVWAWSDITPGQSVSKGVVVPAAKPSPSSSASTSPTAHATPTTATPTTKKTTPAPKVSPSSKPSNVYTAPTVVGFTYLGCTAVSGTVSYQRQYQVVLRGGSYWYYQNQKAPNATLNINLVNASPSMWIRSVDIGIGKSPSSNTGKTARVSLPHPLFSSC